MYLVSIILADQFYILGGSSILILKIEVLKENMNLRGKYFSHWWGLHDCEFVTDSWDWVADRRKIWSTFVTLLETSPHLSSCIVNFLSPMNNQWLIGWCRFLSSLSFSERSYQRLENFKVVCGVSFNIICVRWWIIWD